MSPQVVNAIALAMSLCAVNVIAQADFPNKPITIVVPYSPGGVSDAIGRGVAQKLSQDLKTQVVVDNKAGGNTLIGATYVAKSNPDGYTLLLTAEATLTLNPLIYAKLPYDVDKNFAPIIAIAQVPQSLVISSKLGIGNYQDFVAYAKKNAGKVSYATLGVGSTAHLNFEMFQRTVGLSMQDIPFKGASVAINDLMGGHVDAMIVSTGLIAGQAKSGQLRVLASAGNKRSPLLTDVPTFQEVGISNFYPSSWFALLAPAGTPQDVIQKLNVSVNKILKDDALNSSLFDKFSLEKMGDSSESLRTLIRSDTHRMVPIVRDLGIKLD
jgi:tripartite-type tricarboxylate transporter receptor subunit TctC